MFRKVQNDGDKQHLQNNLDKLVTWSEKRQMGNVNVYTQDKGTWMKTIKWEILF